MHAWMGTMRPWTWRDSSLGAGRWTNQGYRQRPGDHYNIRMVPVTSSAPESRYIFPGVCATVPGNILTEHPVEDELKSGIQEGKLGCCRENSIPVIGSSDRKTNEKFGNRLGKQVVWNQMESLN